MVHNLKHLPYYSNLKMLNMPILKYKRREGGMITAYRILNNLIDMNSNDFFKTGNAKTLGICKKLHKPYLD